MLASGAAALAGCLGANAERAEPAGNWSDGAAMTVTSSAFDDGEAIPTRYTCDGADASPPLTVADVPGEARTLAVVVDDPDAPGDEPFVHWLLWNVPVEGSTVTIPEEVARVADPNVFDRARQGTNGGGSVGYTGPCPPGEKPHTYRFKVHALDARLDVAEAAGLNALERAMEGRVVGRGLLTGTYERGSG